MPDKFTEEVKYFDLGAILTITTRHKLVDHADDFYQIIWYVMESPGMGPYALGLFSEEVRLHILDTYPELKDVVYHPTDDPDKFVEDNKKRFGDSLPLTIITKSLIRVEDESQNPPMNHTMKPGKN